MNKNSIQMIERINRRDGVNYGLAATADGTPLCPHCGQAMVRVGDCFENAACRCWWHGASHATYDLQFSVSATPDIELQYIETRAQHAREHAAREARIQELLPKHLADIAAELQTEADRAGDGRNRKAIAAIRLGKPRWNHAYAARARAEAEVRSETR